MGVYFDKERKHWRYTFQHNHKRYPGRGFKTKRDALQAMAFKRQEVENPKRETTVAMTKKTPTGTGFLTLCNKRLEHVERHNSDSHFRDVRGHAKRWVKKWGNFSAEDITADMLQPYLDWRHDTVSPIVANKDLRLLKALFNYGIKKKLVRHNPANELEFYPEEKRKRRIPPKKDVMDVISVADPEAQDYLWCMLLTAARMNEVNALVWDDVDFDNRTVTLWTRKKKGGHNEPRLVPMSQKLFDILAFRYEKRDPDKPWVFWHTYWSRKEGRRISGPYKERSRLMNTLCEKAGVRYFRFHPFRHFTASILHDLGEPIGTVQSILGHENQKTTEIYLQTVNQAERRAMDKLDRLDIIVDGPTREGQGPTNMHREYWQRKVKRPSLATLRRDISELGYVGTGRKYGVSDNAVRKWIRRYEADSENVSRRYSARIVVASKPGVREKPHPEPHPPNKRG